MKGYAARPATLQVLRIDPTKQEERYNRRSSCLLFL